MEAAAAHRFVIEPSPDHPGWLAFETTDPGSFNPVVLGQMILRAEGERTCRLRAFPQPHLRNLLGTLHGGALLALMDASLFAALHLLTKADAHGSVTLDLTSQFLGPGQIGRPLDTVIELLRETRRIAFFRGQLEQDGNLVAAFTGTVRKTSHDA